jgi:hypothetical protein
MEMLSSASSSILLMVVLPAPEGDDKTMSRPRRPRGAEESEGAMTALASGCDERQASHCAVHKNFS